MARPAKSATITYQPMTLRFPKDMLDAIRDMAEEQDRSINEQTIHLLKQVLKKQPALAGATP